ncbi:MAG TPA: response regulator [Planctomycetota bacterium]|nr:response regulator [Planctomycetota bacterium]
MAVVNDGVVLAALKALSNETKALVMASELEARRMPSFQLRTIFNAMVKDEDERRIIVDLIDKDLQASGYPEDQVFALLNDFLTPANPLQQMNEGVQNTRRLRSPFAHNFEGQLPPVQIGAGVDPAVGATPAPMMGNVQYSPRPSYPAAAETQRMPGPPVTRTGSYATTASQLSPRSTPGQPPPPRSQAARDIATPVSQGAPVPAASRYTQNAFVNHEDMAALQGPGKPQGFNKNSYMPPEPATPSQPQPGLPGLPGMPPVTVRPQTQVGVQREPGAPLPPIPPGLPITATQQSRRFGPDSQNRLTASQSAQAVNEAALLTPGLANISGPMASKIVSRTDGSPNNFQNNPHTSSVRNDGRPVVLIADDDKRIRMVFRLRMEESGLTVVECQDGTEAWERIQQGDISLAVLDMKMPGLHGLEVLSRMADKQYRIPVIVCSAYDQLKDEFVVQTYPRLRYLVKPVAPEQLVGSIKELLVKQN